MKKVILYLALVVALLLPLAACGGTHNQVSTPTAAQTATPMSITTPTLSPTTSTRMTPTTVKGDFEFSPELGPATTHAEHLGNETPVILVHGSGSDMRESTLNLWLWWCGGQYFNSPENSTRFKVYRYVYDSSRHISQNGSDFARFVTEYPAFQDRKIVIMAHSMGGLVTRYALNTNSELRNMTLKLLTLGTPHLGSPFADPTWVCQTPGLDYALPVMKSFFTGSPGDFDLAWYNPDDLPVSPGCSATLNYDSQLLESSLSNPFTGSKDMQETVADNKIIAFGGNTRSIVPVQGWGSLTDHLLLSGGILLMKQMKTREGISSFDNNDGLVPLESALCKTHPNMEAINITDQYGIELDHLSYLDNQKVMDVIMNKLLDVISSPLSRNAVSY